MRLVSFILCLLFFVSFSVAEGVTQETTSKPTTQETQKSGTPHKRVSPQTTTKEPTSRAPSREKVSAGPVKEKPATAKEPAGTGKVTKETTAHPEGKKSAGEAHAPATKPEKAEEKKEEALFSYDEAHKADRKKRLKHSKEPRAKGVEEGSLFSVKEAVEADKGGIHKLVEKPHAAKPEAKEKPEVVKEPKAEEKAKEPTAKKRITKRKKKKDKAKEWNKIELDFAYKNVQLLQGSYSFETHFVGEMINGSGRDFGIVKFMFSTYNKRGKLLTEEAFQITDFYNGQVKIFKGTIIDTYKRIASQKIRFLSAAPTSRD